MTPRPKQATKLRDVCIHTRACVPLTGTLTPLLTSPLRKEPLVLTFVVSPTPAVSLSDTPCQIMKLILSADRVRVVGDEMRDALILTRTEYLLTAVCEVGSGVD